jgi:hypothetical protein
MREGQRQRTVLRPGACHDAARDRAGQQRRDGQAQLIEQVRGEELGQQVWASLGEDPLVAALGKGAGSGLHVDVVLARHDDVRAGGQLGAAVRRRRAAGDDDRARVRRGIGEQAAVRVEIEAHADHRDRRCRRPPFAQVTPQLAGANRGITLGAHG